MGLAGFYSIFTRFSGFPLNLTAFYWVLSGLIEFIGCYYIYTTFYWFLLDLTGFD